MDPIHGDKLLQVSLQLDAILETLAGIKESIERRDPPVMVEDYFGILVAFERITEANQRLSKIAEDWNHKEKVKNKSKFALNP